MIKHDMIIEERFFSKDIDSLKDYDEGFKTAYENGIGYEFTIKLCNLFELCPRKARKKQVYERFMAFLCEKGIMMKIISRKSDKKTKECEN